MKKHGTLNSEISAVLSKLGHTDLIMICDCGLPTLDDVKRIDIALNPGTPSFIDVLATVIKDLEVEKYYLANEIETENKKVLNQVQALLASCECEMLSHKQLKQMSSQVKAIIRTGEITPYANIILQSGVNFEELYENYSKQY